MKLWAFSSETFISEELAEMLYFHHIHFNDVLEFAASDIDFLLTTLT